LKNFLFSRVQAKADLAALQRRWKALVETVRQERFPDFLRYHLLCELPQVRKQRLFKLVQARTYGMVNLTNLPVFKLHGNMPVCSWVFGKNQYAGSFFI
jgi:hypothetical protein